jgi:hypothetical protein
MIYFHANEFQRAQYLLGEALLLDPANIDGFCIRGVALLRTQALRGRARLFPNALDFKWISSKRSAAGPAYLE